MIYLILDSNQIIKDYKLEGAYFQAMRVFLDTQGARLVVPRVVVDEVVAHLRRDLMKKCDKLDSFADAWRKFDTDLPIKPADLREAIDGAVSKYRERLMGLLTAISTEIPELPEVGTDNVVSRILDRKKPIGPKGEGVIDYLIWRIAVEYTQQRGDVHFISSNSKDFGKGEEPLPADLGADVAGARYKLMRWDNLGDFLDTHAVRDDQLEMEWLKQQPAFLEMLQTAERATAAFQKLANAYLEDSGDVAAAVKVNSIKDRDWLYWHQSTEFQADLMIPLAVKCSCLIEPQRQSRRDARQRSDFVDMHVEITGTFELSGKSLTFKSLISGSIKDFDGYEQPESPPMLLINDLVFDENDTEVIDALRRRAGEGPMD